MKNRLSRKIILYSLFSLLVSGSVMLIFYEMYKNSTKENPLIINDEEFYQEAPINNDIYKNLAHFGNIAYLRGGKYGQFSSYDSSGGNEDYNNVLRVEPNGDSVLADMKGPGCITRIWMTGKFLKWTKILIYFDGEETPTVYCNAYALFGRKVYYNNSYRPFVNPLSGEGRDTYYCYIPMPYKESCVVKLRGAFQLQLFYQIDYITFDNSEGVTTFTLPLQDPDNSYLNEIGEMWNNSGKDPKGYDVELERVEGNMTITPYSRHVLMDVNDKGIIWRIWVNICPNSSRGTKNHPINRIHHPVNNIKLRMYWDDESDPSVNSPLGAFFGGGFGMHNYTALPMGIMQNGSYCYFPMPFNRSAKIELVSQGSETIENFRYIIEYKKLNELPPEMGRFHAKWKYKELSPQNGNYVILQTTGKGHFVGCQVYLNGLINWKFLEGDAVIYVDREVRPVALGTGTEDYFNEGWYFSSGKVSHPLHGCHFKDDDTLKVSAYRFHINDYIPYDSAIKVTLEHGSENSQRASYASVAYWYAEAG